MDNVVLIFDASLFSSISLFKNTLKMAILVFYMQSMCTQSAEETKGSGLLSAHLTLGTISFFLGILFGKDEKPGIV
jgi:hypothetical protein